MIDAGLAVLDFIDDMFNEAALFFLFGVAGTFSFDEGSPSYLEGFSPRFSSFVLRARDIDYLAFVFSGKTGTVHGYITQIGYLNLCRPGLYSASHRGRTRDMP